MLRDSWDEVGAAHPSAALLWPRVTCSFGTPTQFTLMGGDLILFFPLSFLPATGTATIKIKDVNDNAPTCNPKNIDCKVSEDTKIGVILPGCHVSCTDEVHSETSSNDPLLSMTLFCLVSYICVGSLCSLWTNFAWNLFLDSHFSAFRIKTNLHPKMNFLRGAKKAVHAHSKSCQVGNASPFHALASLMCYF